MDLAHAARRDVLVKQLPAVAGGEADVGEAALVGTAGRVTQDEGQDVDAEVVMLGPPNGAAEQEPAVAAAEIENDRGLPAEERFPVEPAGRQLLEGGLGPERRVENLTGDGNAEFTFDAPARMFGHIRSVSRGRVERPLERVG